jgi:ADP-dependent NAD(P)H-hydrate dehydratase / NAD(P)H-hydrate epimerase
MSEIPAHPILSCEEALAFEEALLGKGEQSQWKAMLSAGRALAAAALGDFEEIGGFPPAGRVLVLAGKGHNAGDAVLAAGEILRLHPGACAEVVFALGQRELRPLALKAWQSLSAFGERARVADPSGSPAYDLCLGGVFGARFRPPLDRGAAKALRWANSLPIRLRAAVDLPSGLDEPSAFRADFTYATGILKAPLLGCANAGRIRYLDLGFFDPPVPEGGTPDSEDLVLLPSVLRPLASLRPAVSDKRSYGHLCLFGGSRDYPGAILMAVLSALRSGVGLVTAHVPASLAPGFAARAPEAMWVGWPETADGGLALGTQERARASLAKADALVIGPGLGRDPETLSLVSRLVKLSWIPVLIDADALQPDLVRGAKAPLVLTPHAGEFARIGAGADLRSFAIDTGATVVLKGPVTRIAAPGNDAAQACPVYHSFQGGPVLARGGSGDLLAGLAGGLLAQTPKEPQLAAARGVAWHGMAADRLARASGQTAVAVTQLLDHLPEALRAVAMM